MTDLPKWRHADRTVDVTDAWNDLRDPENEVGAEVIACLHISTYTETEPADPDGRPEYVPVYRVEGLVRRTVLGIAYYGRDWCVANGLAPMLHQIEETANT